MKRSLLVAALVLGLGTTFVLARQQPPPVLTCSLEGKGTFPVGFGLHAGTELNPSPYPYQCLVTFDGSLKGNGVAWIRVVGR